MWCYRYLRWIDFRIFPFILALMGISLLVNSAMTQIEGGNVFLTNSVVAQIQWFVLGWIGYFFFAGVDYQQLRSWSWALYVGVILLLVGLFLTTPIQHVQRWYRLPFLGRGFQPSEYAKIILIIVLSHFLDSKAKSTCSFRTVIQALILAAIPFFLILKQPDLGSALVLYPMILVIFYVGGIHKTLVRSMALFGIAILLLVGLIFTHLISYETLRPYATAFLKEYQYERLNPHTYHQKAAQTAIALGGVCGSGWHKSTFSGHEWLPAAHTDSAFAAYAEEFGLTGVIFMLLCFFGLIYFSFQVTAKAKDPFGKLLSLGITIYLATHVIVNIGMMCGFLPITGVPLLLITYGGSSVVSTMVALGVLQSIYSRRFLF